MRDALLALNNLVTKGVVQQYAIGGAVAASFYIEAVQTEDLDAFVFLAGNKGALTLLTPVYTELVQLGGVIEGAHVRFGQWPIQILTDANELIGEAIREARNVFFEGIATRVFRADYLCAIALQTGRSKDFLRVIFFLEQGKVDRNALASLASRFHLTDKLQRLPKELWSNDED